MTVSPGVISGCLCNGYKQRVSSPAHAFLPLESSFPWASLRQMGQSTQVEEAFLERSFLESDKIRVNKSWTKTIQHGKERTWGNSRQLFSVFSRRAFTKEKMRRVGASVQKIRGNFEVAEKPGTHRGRSEVCKGQTRWPNNCLLALLFLAWGRRKRTESGMERQGTKQESWTSRIVVWM